MPYTFPHKLPRVAKNWSASEQKKCVSAANAVLNEGGSEQDAVFACIHAAGKGKKNMKRKSETMMFFKDQQNALWFVGIYSNNYEDRQHDIISEAAHREYAQWLKTTGVKPPIVMLHLPRLPEVVHYAMLLGLATGRLTVQKYNQHLMDLYQSTAIARTEAVFIKNGFAFVFGKVIESKRALVESVMRSQKIWGMSHGFIPLKFDDNIINQYRTFEFTLAPEVIAANGLTAIGFKEGKMDNALLKDLSEEERQVIQQVLDEEDADTATSKAREILRDLLVSKMDQMDDEEKEHMMDDEDKEDDEASDGKKKMLDDGGYTTLVVKLADTFKLDELAQVLKNIGDRLTAIETQQQATAQELVEVKKTEDQRVVDQYFKGIDWSLGYGQKRLTAAPTAEETALVEQLKGEAVDQIVEDKKVDPNNVLQLGFWGPLLGGS